MKTLRAALKTRATAAEAFSESDLWRVGDSVRGCVRVRTRALGGGGRQRLSITP